MKNPEQRIDHAYIQNCSWFKFFYESDITDECPDSDLRSYDFSNPRIFMFFQLLRDNNFEADFFLKVYEQQIKKCQSKRKDAEQIRPVTPKGEYEFYNQQKKIKETTKKHQIKHQIVESELYSLENSTQSFYEKFGRNKLTLNSEQKHCLRRELSNEFLLSDVETPGAFTILNQMVTFTRLKFDQFRSGDVISHSTVSKFGTHARDPFSQRFLLDKSDKVILRVLEKMCAAGFPLKQIQLSVRKKKLDAAWATFRMLAQSLSNP